MKNDAQFSNTSGNATVAYDVADATNVYLRYATGYRSGGFNGEIFGGLRLKRKRSKPWNWALNPM